MPNLPVFVGLDYHSKMIQVCVMDQKKKIPVNTSVANDPEAVFRVVCPFGSNVHVAVEACTGSSDFAETLISKYNWSVSLAHPGYTARMKQTPDKSDWTDAKLLADLLRAGYLPQVWLAPKNIRNLRAMVRYRHGLVGQRTQVKLRLRALLRDNNVKNPANPWTKAWKAWLFSKENPMDENAQWILKQHFDEVEHFDKLILESEKRMEQMVADDAVVRHLLQQPGVGLITATTMRAMIGHFDRFRTGKQLAHFCAVTPRNNSTGGKTTTAGLVKAGDPLLRNVLLEAAHRLMRYDPQWKNMADRLRANKKKGCVIAVAVANRWIRKLFHQMMDFHGKLETASLPFKEKCETVLAKTPCPVGEICTTVT